MRSIPVDQVAVFNLIGYNTKREENFIGMKFKISKKMALSGAGLIVLAVVLAFLIISRGAGQDDQILGLDVQWVNPSINHTSLRFDYAGEGLYLIEASLANGESRFGFADGTGSVVIPVIHSHASTFTEGMAYVEANGRRFFVDPLGAEVLDVSEYNSARPFEFGFSVVRRTYMQEVGGGVSLSHFEGILDADGNTVLPTEFERAGAFENGMLWAVLDGMYAMFDNSGNRITPHEFEQMSCGGEGMVIAQRGGRFGHLDRNGDVVTPFDFDMVGRFYDGVAFVIYNTLAGYINASGEQITPIHFIAAESFSEGRAAVSTDGLYGFIDTQGNMVIPAIYDEVWPFENGVAVVMQIVARAAVITNTIDIYGQTVIVPEEMGFFRWRDVNIAYNDPFTGAHSVNFNIKALLDDEGRLLTGFAFSDISTFYSGIAVAQTPGEFAFSYGIINQYGTEIIPPTFEKIEIIDANTIIVQYPETDADSGAQRSRIGVITLPDDAATRQPEIHE